MEILLEMNRTTRRIARRGHFQILSAIFYFSKIFLNWKFYRFPGDMFSASSADRVAA